MNLISQTQIIGPCLVEMVDAVKGVRRRKAKEIIRELDLLGSKVDRDDFEVMAFPLVNAIRNALETLRDARTEGNAREVLRCVRDSLLNGGAVRYRNEGVRAAARQALLLLLEETVTPSHTAKAFDLLEDAGADAIGVPLFAYDAADTQQARRGRNRAHPIAGLEPVWVDVRRATDGRISLWLDGAEPELAEREGGVKIDRIQALAIKTKEPT